MSESGLERWLSVVGFEASHEVSDHGRVRSIDRVVQTRAGWTRPWRGRVLAGRDVNGYRSVALPGYPSKLVHRLVLEAFIGQCPDGMECCHNNGVRNDNRLSNLRWDTTSANMFDKQRHGTDHMRNKACCPRRHPLVSPNLVAHTAADGRRQCLACARTFANRKLQRYRGLPFDFQALADEHFARIMVGTATVYQRDRQKCPRGHLLAVPNLMEWVLKKGYRSCLACGRARSKAKYVQKVGGELVDLQAESDRQYAEITGLANIATKSNAATV